MKLRYPLAYCCAILFIMSGCATTPAPDIAAQTAPASAASTHDVKILRDTWGVPHIFGKTDADTAYGLAYAHCEDDFKNIQDSMLAVRSLGSVVGGADAAAIDYIVYLLGVWDSVNAKYETDLSPEVRAVCEAYAEGVNLYAEKHPEEVALQEIFPVTGKDIVAGFVFKSPFFYGLDGVILELFGPTRQREVSTKTAARLDFTIPEAFALAKEKIAGSWPTGSNTFSVAPSRTADGSTYLNINSHQPYDGPVAWYEAHLHSEEGWDMVGGLFPGMPVIGHGHNRNLGWAHTVNSPDLADVYVLEMNPDNKNQYKYDGEWKDLEVSYAPLRVRINPDSKMTMNIRREVLRSIHGPVIRADHGVYAIRYAGMGEIKQVEQWYRMNKAQNFEEWKAAMSIQGISSLNAGYADKEGNIMYLYNAQLPMRTAGYDWKQYLPGNTSDTLWTRYLPFDKLPMVINPKSGFVQNCNSSPFLTSFGDDNPKESDYDPNFGIETRLTNRAMRARELFEPDTSITWDEFRNYKFDKKYSANSFMVKTLEVAFNAPAPDDALTQEALAVLKNWDRNTNRENRGAALAVMTVLPLNNSAGTPPAADKVMDSLRKAAQLLKEKHGRVDPPWGEVNRLIRGSVDLPVGGGPDTIRAVYGALNEDTGRYKGQAGDTYIMLVKWDADGKLTSESIHQYGSATMTKDSPHYADQAPLFAREEFKPVWMDEADIRAHLEREYIPGE